MSETSGLGSASAAAPRERHRLAVLGMGQIGGSIALAGRAAGLFGTVVGFGRNMDSLDRARHLGLCDLTTTSAADAVSSAEVVVLATPLRAVPAIVEAIAPLLRADTLVIDVGSVKGTVVRDVERRLPPIVDFVACHPLAGTEQFGPDAARVDLFQGRKCLLCPTPRTRSRALARARALWEAMGAVVSPIDADLHDQVMAAVSHLPHVAAYALAGALGGLETETSLAAREMPTTSLRDTSRVAASSPAMWTDIFLENRAVLLPLVHALGEQVSSLEEAIEARDEARIKAWLENGKAIRARLLPE